MALATHTSSLKADWFLEAELDCTLTAALLQTGCPSSTLRSARPTWLPVAICS